MPRHLALAALAALALAACTPPAAGRSLTQNFADALNGGGNRGQGNGNGNGRPWQNGDNNNNNQAPSQAPASAPSPGDAPPEVTAGPSGKVKDASGAGTDSIPSNDAVKGDARGAKLVAPTQLGIKGTGAQQTDESGKGLTVGTPIDVNQAKSQNGAKQASSASFTDELNSAGDNGGAKPELRGAPSWGGGGGGGGSYGIMWLSANVYTIPRYDPGSLGFLGAILGWGSSQLVTIVLDDWAARVNGWGPQPVFRSPAVGFTFAWNLNEYRWYGAKYGNWGWKSPPLGLTMRDALGNRLEAEVYVGLNLRSWEVVSVNVPNYWFAGNNWGK